MHCTSVRHLDSHGCVCMTKYTTQSKAHTMNSDIHQLSPTSHVESPCRLQLLLHPDAKPVSHPWPPANLRHIVSAIKAIPGCRLHGPHVALGERVDFTWEHGEHIDRERVDQRAPNQQDTPHRVAPTAGPCSLPTLRFRFLIKLLGVGEGIRYSGWAGRACVGRKRTIRREAKAKP